MAGPEVQAADQTRLLNLGQGEAVEETVLRLAFSKRPRYRLEVSGQRIDLFLYDTAIGPAFAAAPQQGGSVASITLTEKLTGLMVTFHLSGIPRGARVEMAGGHGMDLEVHVLWASEAGNVQAQAAPRLVGGTGGADADNSITARLAPKSQYAPNWERFYREFESPLAWPWPVRYTLPDLPDLGGCPNVVLREIWQRSRLNAWVDVAGLLKRLDGAKFAGEERQVFMLLSGASLLRAGQYEATRKLYWQFRAEFPASPYLKRFTVMAASGLARLGDPYGAVTEVTPLLSRGNELGKRGEAAAELLYAEVQLAIGRPQKGLSALAVATGDGPGLARSVLLRTADARSAMGQYREALPGYRRWLAQPGQDSMDLYSLAHWAEALEKGGDLKAAEQVYSRLGEIPQAPEGQAMALFAAARAVRKLGQIPVALERCATIRRLYSGSAGAMRAWLLALDMTMLGGDQAGIAQHYGEYAILGATAQARALREEASFKYALAVLLRGDNAQGVSLLRAFRRDFASGPLRSEAEVLLLQKLEPLVAGLLQAGQSYDAMVLIEQNRDLLSAFTLSPGFAVQVAQVFREMGMYARAADIYLYLIGHAENKTVEEAYYLPLAEVLYANGLHDDLLAAVGRYRLRFPTGKSLAALVALHGQLLIELGRLDEAAVLLKHFKNDSAALLALRNRLAVALTLRDGLGGGALAGVLTGKASEVEQPAARLLRAERLLGAGKAEQALAQFQQLIAAGLFVDQSRYRCGQIYLARGDRQRGVNFLSELVEKGKEKYWQDLAREMLALSSIR